jgi:hypothetical protein
MLRRFKGRRLSGHAVRKSVMSRIMVIYLRLEKDNYFRSLEPVSGG